MLRYELDADDVSSVRFAVSPIGETSLALRALLRPDRFPLQRPWVDRLAPLRSALDVEALSVLIDDRMRVADFATPRPAHPSVSVDDELRVLRELPRARLEADLVRLHGGLPTVVADDHRAAERIASALGRLWRLGIAPHWSRMRAVLDADIAHRGRLVTRDGLASMLNGLSPAVRYDDGRLDVRLTRDTPRPRPVAGVGLVLGPSIFVARASVPNDDGALPHLSYPARGQGAMWGVPGISEGDRLVAAEAVLGAVRTRLLVRLGEPASTVELARTAGVTDSAVSQHLRALHRAGLLRRSRHGRHVLYLRSETGDALLGLGGTGG